MLHESLYLSNTILMKSKLLNLREDTCSLWSHRHALLTCLCQAVGDCSTSVSALPHWLMERTFQAVQRQLVFVLLEMVRLALLDSKLLKTFGLSIHGNDLDSGLSLNCLSMSSGIQLQAKPTVQLFNASSQLSSSKTNEVSCERKSVSVNERLTVLLLCDWAHQSRHWRRANCSISSSWPFCWRSLYF